MNGIKVNYNKRDRCFFGKFKDPESGKWKTKSIPVNIGTEAEALVWFANWKTGLAASHVAPLNHEVVIGTPTIASLFSVVETYWSTVRTNRHGERLEPKTVSDWLGKIRLHVLTHPISNLPLTVEKFTPIALVDFVESLKAKDMATYTVRDTCLVLRMFIGDCRKKGWCSLPFNPVADEIVSSEVPICAPLSGKDNPIHLSKLEATQLITCCSDKIPFGRKAKNLVALTTGIRDSEVCGLAWKHVNLEARYLVVDRQLVKAGKSPTFKPCKYGSERTIPLHCLTVAALAKLKPSYATDEDPVFPDPRTGRFARPRAAKQFRDDLQTAGISSLYQGKFFQTFHAARRTWMTLLSDAAVPDEMIGAMAGHAKKGVRKHYVKDHLDKFIPQIEKLPFNMEIAWLQ